MSNSEQCYEWAFYAVLWPPLYLAERLTPSGEATNAGIALAIFIGLLLLPVTGPVAALLAVAGKLISFLEKDDCES